MKERDLAAHEAYVHEAQIARETRVGERYVARMFDLDPAVDADLRILDLGSARTHYRQLGNVTQLDYLYAAHPAPKGRGDAVAGLAQELPFADNSFDAVIARYLSRYSVRGMSRESTAATVQEALRVLNIGGILQIYPATFSDALPAALDRLKISAHYVSVEVTPKHSRPIGIKAVREAIALTPFGVGIAIQNPALIAGGVVLGGVAGLLNYSESFHDRKNGVLTIEKTQRMNAKRERQHIADAVAPFLTAPQTLVNYEKEHGYRQPR